MTDGQDGGGAGAADERNYVVTRVMTAEELVRAIEAGDVEGNHEIFVSLGIHVADDPGDAIRTVAEKLEPPEGTEFAATTERYWRRAKPREKIEKKWVLE